MLVLGDEADAMSAQLASHFATPELEVTLDFFRLDQAVGDAVNRAHSSPPRVTLPRLFCRFLFGTMR